MSLKRKEDTAFEKELFTGFFLGTPRGYVNPTAAQLAEMKGYELKSDAKEPEYESKNQAGEDVVTIMFYLQSENGKWFPVKHRLVDRPVIAKESGKQQFVNQCGGDFGSYWVDSKENLPDWFTHYQKGKVNVADKYYRPAIQGEAGLYQFLNVWYDHVEWRDIESNILIDVKKLFRNPNKYVQEQYQPHLDIQNKLDKETVKAAKEVLKKESLVEPVVALATVYTGEDKDGNIVHYQNLYGSFLSHYKMKKISYAVSSGNWNDKDLANYHKQITGPKGIKDSYTLTLLQTFDPNNHQQATNNLFVDNSGANTDPNDTNY